MILKRKRETWFFKIIRSTSSFVFVSLLVVVGISEIIIQPPNSNDDVLLHKISPFPLHQHLEV